MLVSHAHAHALFFAISHTELPHTSHHPRGADKIIEERETGGDRTPTSYDARPEPASTIFLTY